MKLSKIIKGVFNKAGYSLIKNTTYDKLIKHSSSRITKNSKNNLLNNLYSIISQQGFYPSAIYDIGANKGTWTNECLKVFPDASYYLFEPQITLKQDIDLNLGTYQNINVYSVGLGDKNETLKFTMHKRDDSRSFLYSENDASSLGVEQIELPVVRLDTFIKEKKLPIPDLIKIDAEGFDIKVLTGAGDYLQKAEVVLVEVGIMNLKMPNSAKVVLNFMDEKGFRLFEITDLNRPFKNNILWLCEFVFIKKNGILDKNYAPEGI
jgi:FkbM family methyltransferase